MVARELVRAISRVISKETEVSQRDSWFHAYGYTAHDTQGPHTNETWVQRGGEWKRRESGRGIVDRKVAKRIRTTILFK